MKKIGKMLFITTQFPFPMDNGGKIGALNGISVVSSAYDVTVLSFSEEPDTIFEGMRYFKEKFPDVKFINPVIHDVHIRKKTLKLIFVILRSYLKKLPYLSAKFEDQKMYKLITQMFKNKIVWDVIFIDYINMNVYADYIRRNFNNQFKHLIFKDHNIEYEIIEQAANSSNGIYKAFLKFESGRTFRYEVEAIKNAELLFSVCENNTGFLRKYNSKAYTMLPTYDVLPHRALLPKQNNILYVGNLSWKANMDGVEWFVEKVLPCIKKEIPDVLLTIVGSGPSKNLFADIPEVKYRGYVKDIDKIYDDQKVFVVPLFEGSGIRIKILEAFNNEIAVVSTALGCATIKAKSGKELFIADGVQDFAKAVILLLSDDDLNNSIRMSGKTLLCDKFSLIKRQEEFRSIVENIFKEC